MTATQTSPGQDRPPSGHPLLIDAAALHQRLAIEGANGSALRVVDLRWSPAAPSARQRYDAHHIPGAVFADMDKDLSRAQPSGPGGRHPMTSPEQFAEVLARLGIAENTDVVVYDDGTGQIAARLWFQLRLHGHWRVSLLDGGLWAWTKAGFPTDSRESIAPPAPLRKLIRDGSQLVGRARIAELVAHRKDATGKGSLEPTLLLDARAPERYRGEVEPLDRVAGHIPGAVNLPGARLARGPDDPRWRPPDEVRALLDGAGVKSPPDREVIASCGSGVTACHLLAAMELAGVHGAKLYAGSYSDWVSAPDAEIARGGEPG